MIAFAVLLLSLTAGRLSEEHRRWLNEDVIYIILEKERDVFLDLETEEQRDLFIEAFWAKRDPYPATLENEYETEHYRRIQHANEYFSRDAPMPGWRTDRGRYYIILGEPASVQSYDGINQVVSSELWYYNGDPDVGLPSRFNLLFFRDYQVGHYELYHPFIHGPERLLRAGSSPSLIADARQTMDILENVSPDLAIAALSIDLTEMSTAILSDATASSYRTPSMSTDVTLANIAESPRRHIDTNDLDGFLRYGNRVSAEYSFRFVPNRFDVSVLPGPEKTPFVHFILELDPENFSVEDDGTGRFHTTLDIGIELRDAAGHVIAIDNTVPIEISASDLRQVATLPFAYEDDFPVAVPGSYNLSVTLRNRMTKHFTVAEVDIDVPSFGEANGLSDIVLAHREERVADTYLTFQMGGMRHHPATEGVFAIGDTVHAFTAAPPEHRVRFEILDGEDVVTAEESVTGSAKLSLIGFAGGRYRLRARLVDRAGDVVAERSRTLTVSPRSAIPRAGLVYRQGFYAEVPGLLSMARGEQLLVVGRVAEAIAELQKSVGADNPKLPMAKWKLATALLHAREADRALQILLPLTEEYPNEYDVAEGLGLAYYLKGEHDAAIPYLERAMSIRSPDVPVLNALGFCYRDAGRDEDANALFARSLELDPDQPVLQSQK
ncbi:MAG: hypothetical protein BMS9Abin37_2598 [Acidobacteriota bacterium]|nr:MAG: hypothetical protein BMS9Abin37_2598 [Acidobacteriota bacterium]